MVVHKKQIIIFMGLAAAVGTFGLIQSAFLASLLFFALAIANYIIAGFFAFKYFTYDRSVRKAYNSRKSGNRRYDRRR